MAYATVNDLAKYMDIKESELPDDTTRLLDRASELIETKIMHNYDEEIEDHVEGAKQATCAQIEYWLNMSEDIDITNMPHNVSIGSFSMGSGQSSSSSFTKLAPRARRLLFTSGLLYAGRGTK